MILPGTIIGGGPQSAARIACELRVNAPAPGCGRPGVHLSDNPGPPGWRLIAPMPLLAYLAGQRDPDGHMIIVALDLNVGMEIDVCHFFRLWGARTWP